MGFRIPRFLRLHSTAMAAHALDSQTQPAAGPLGWYARVPLYAKIVIGMITGALLGKLLGHVIAYSPNPIHKERAVNTLKALKALASTVLQLLQLLATPLVFIAVIHAIVKAQGSGKSAARLLWLVMSNTVMAILVGLLIANTIRPGTRVHLPPPTEVIASHQNEGLLSKVPHNFIDPFQKNDILPLIIIAVSMGIAMRKVRAKQLIAGKHAYKPLEDLLDTGFDLVMVMLHWVLALVPFAVFAVVAATVGKEGMGPLKAMLIFVVSVVAALFLQACFYLCRLRLGSWVHPLKFLKGASDALFLAFSTASSAVTLPVTYSCVKDKIGVREENAGLGVMVGGTFNHDGTALYEAMAALFIAQAIGLPLPLGHRDRADGDRRQRRGGGDSRGGNGHHDRRLQRRRIADRIYPAAAPARLVPGSLPHRNQCHGRYERGVPARWQAPAWGR